MRRPPARKTRQANATVLRRPSFSDIQPAKSAPSAETCKMPTSSSTWLSLRLKSLRM